MHPAQALVFLLKKYAESASHPGDAKKALDMAESIETEFALESDDRPAKPSAPVTQAVKSAPAHTDAPAAPAAPAMVTAPTVPPQPQALHSIGVPADAPSAAPVPGKAAA